MKTYIENATTRHQWRDSFAPKAQRFLDVRFPDGHSHIRIGRFSVVMGGKEGLLAAPAYPEEPISEEFDSDRIHQFGTVLGRLFDLRNAGTPHPLDAELCAGMKAEIDGWRS